MENKKAKEAFLSDKFYDKERALIQKLEGIHLKKIPLLSLNVPKESEYKQNMQEIIPLIDRGAEVILGTGLAVPNEEQRIDIIMPHAIVRKSYSVYQTADGKRKRRVSHALDTRFKEIVSEGSFDEIVSVSSKTKQASVVGQAIAGGIIAGDVGAMVGAANAVSQNASGGKKVSHIKTAKRYKLKLSSSNEAVDTIIISTALFERFGMPPEELVKSRKQNYWLIQDNISGGDRRLTSAQNQLPHIALKVYLDKILADHKSNAQHKISIQETTPNSLLKSVSDTTNQETDSKSQNPVEQQSGKKSTAQKKSKMPVIAILLAAVIAVGAFFVYNNANKQKSDAYEAAAANQETGIAAEAFEEKLSAYSSAIDGFTALGDYNDSQARLAETKEAAYTDAVAILNSSQYYSFDDALELLAVVGDYKDSNQISQTVIDENGAMYELWNLTTITDEDVEKAKALLTGNTYFNEKHMSDFSAAVRLFDELGNREWEYLSGDATVLNVKTGQESRLITTDICRENGWQYSQLYIYYGDAKIYLNADYGNDTFTQDIFSGVDFTAKLTEQGTLVIEAKTKDAVKICEYKAIN